MSRAKIALEPGRFERLVKTDAQPKLPPSGRRLLWELRLAAGRTRDFTLRATGKLPSNSLRVALYRRIFRMTIGQGARIDSDCIIWGPGRIRIGRGTAINRGVILDGRFPLTIGEHVSISIQAVILTLQHDLADAEFKSVGAPVLIGDRVFVGARAIILPGVTIGEGAAVAAGAVVTRDVEPFTIVAGMPARPIGRRPEGLIYRLS